MAKRAPAPVLPKLSALERLDASLASVRELASSERTADATCASLLETLHEGGYIPECWLASVARHLQQRAAAQAAHAAAINDMLMMKEVRHA